MNRGNRKLFVTGVLIVLSIIAAFAIELIGGSAGASSSPGGSSSSGGSGGTGGSSAPRVVTPLATGTVNSAVYHTVGSEVNLRAAASTNAAVITVMHDLKSPVTLTCYLSGSSIAGDPWWYRATFVSARGYVSGYWVDTGPDPAKTRLPAC